MSHHPQSSEYISPSVGRPYPANRYQSALKYDALPSTPSNIGNGWNAIIQDNLMTAPGLKDDVRLIWSMRFGLDCVGVTSQCQQSFVSWLHCIDHLRSSKWLIRV